MLYVPNLQTVNKRKKILDLQCEKKISDIYRWLYGNFHTLTETFYFEIKLHIFAKQTENALFIH